MHKSIHLMNKNKNKDIFTRLMNFGQAEELKKQRIFRKNHQLKFQTKNYTKRREKIPARENIKLMIPSILSDTVPKCGPSSPRSKTIDAQEKGDLYSLVALYHGVGNSLPKHYKVKPKSNLKFPRISEGNKIQLVSKITNSKRIKSKPKSVNKIYHLKSFEKGSSESIKKRKNIKRMTKKQKSQLSSTVNELFPRHTHQVEDEETANLSSRKLISASLDTSISKSKTKTTPVHDQCSKPGMSLSSLTAIELAEKVRSQTKPIEKKHLFHKMSESQVSTYRTPLSKSKQAFDQDNGLYILRESMYNKYYNKPGDSPKSTRLTTNRRVRPKNITKLQLSKQNLTEKGILSFFMNKV